MAQLTYDPTPADQPEFNEAEQEALAIGEAQAQAEEQIYAGKFKDAEALEQAYIELQKKLGETNAPDSEQEGLRETEATEEVETEEPNLLESAYAEFNDKGELSTETMEKLTSMDSKDLIQAYMESQDAASGREMSSAEVDSIYKLAGGQEQYGKLMEWATGSLPEATVNAYNSVVDRGDPAAIQLALAGITAAYRDTYGSEGTTLTGKPPVNKQDVFRSQAEVVQAMSDPRYDSDPAYRQDIFNKLERSPIQY